MNTISTYNTYLSTHQLSNYSESSIGWIFSVYIFLTFFCGIQIGPFFDAQGPRLLVLLGSILMMASIMLMGICSRMYSQSLQILGSLSNKAQSTGTSSSCSASSAAPARP